MIKKQLTCPLGNIIETDATTLGEQVVINSCDISILKEEVEQIVIPETNNLKVSDPLQESLSTTAQFQSEINIENKDAIDIIQSDISNLNTQVIQNTSDISDLNISQLEQDLEIENNTSRIDGITALLSANGTAIMELNGTGGTITTTPNQLLLVNATIRTQSNNPQFLNFVPSPTIAHFTVGLYGNFGMRFNLNVDPVGGQDRVLSLNLYNATQGISLGSVKEITIPGSLTYVNDFISVQLNTANYTLGDSIYLRGQAVGANIITSNVSIEAGIIGSGGGSGGNLNSSQISDTSSWGGSSVLISLNNSKTESDSQNVRITTLENTTVKTTGNQTIGGNKNFTGITSVFELIPSGSNTTINVAGNITMSSGSKIIQPSAPTGVNDVTNKTYVDSKQTPVLLTYANDIIWNPNNPYVLREPITNFTQVLFITTGDRNFASSRQTSNTWVEGMVFNGTNRFEQSYGTRVITWEVSSDGATLTINSNTDQSTNGLGIVKVYGIGKKTNQLLEVIKDEETI